ncbi:hypothetical protein [Acidocella sp.]|uniref:hypothetical protein n=1 Tax=Acidocella sp. TaxID=50710 RepID=UPI002625232D|nr:hypothetical protein [Acidocella sp.]
MATGIIKIMSDMTIENWLDLVLALMAGISAVVTAFMAVYTKNLATETKESLAQAERHHRESLQPLSVAEFPPSAPGSFLGMAQTVYQENGNDLPAIQVSGKLTNKGLGPALEIYFYVVDIEGFRLTYPIFLQETLGPHEECLISSVIKPRSLIGTYHNDGRGDTWRANFGPEFILIQGYYLVISYKDIFESEFSTIYARGRPQNIENDIKAISDEEVRRKIRNTLHHPAPVFRKGTQFPKAYDER